MSFESAYGEIVKHPLTAAKGMTGHLTAYRPRYARPYNAIQRHLPVPTGRIIDVGCGYGVALRLLRGLGFTECLGVDLFTTLEQSFLADLSGATIIRGDLETAEALAGVPDGSCKCALSNEVLEHLFNHPVRYLEECLRVLRPGGLFVIDIPNPCTAINAWRMIRGTFETWGDADFAMLRKVDPDGSLKSTWNIHYREYPPQVLRRLTALLPGAKLLESGYVGTAPAPTEAWAKRLAKRVVSGVGLANHRLFANVQYLVIRKGE